VPDPSPHALTVTASLDVMLAVVLVRRGKAAEVSRIMHARRGFELPSPGRLNATGNEALLWSGPDRYLSVREDGAPDLAGEMAASLDGLAYVAEATSSRSVLGVSGHAAAEWLNRLVPIDLHPRAFTVGSVALTVAAHVPIQIWRPDETWFRLACPGSFAASFEAAINTA